MRRSVVGFALAVMGCAVTDALGTLSLVQGLPLPLNIVAPDIVGSATIGGTLVAVPGKWTNPNHLTPVVDGSYALIFDEEFNGTTLDLTRWNPAWFGATPTTVTEPINGSMTAAYDPIQNVVKGGFLTQTTVANSITVGTKCTPCPDRTGHIDTNPSSGSTAGGFVGFAMQPSTGNPIYVEARMFIPGDNNATPNVVNWPDFFTSGQTFPTTGETDIAEGGHVSTVTGMTANYHSGAGNQNSGLFASNYTGWHVFGVKWSTVDITYFYDGIQVQQWTTGIAPPAPNYIHVENAMGSTVAGADAIPATVLTEYVHAYLHGGAQVAAQSNYGGSGAFFTSYSYQWNRNTAPIVGATSATYIPVTADTGSTISVTVRAANSLGTGPPATSAAVGPI